MTEVARQGWGPRRLLAARAGLALVGAIAGGVVGLASSLAIFLGFVGLVSQGGHGGGFVGLARESLGMALLGVGLPCLLGGIVLFAVPPSDFGALAVRMSVCTGLSAAFGYVSFDDGVYGLILMGTMLSIPLWLLCLLSLPAGLLLKRLKRGKAGAPGGERRAESR